jgi:LysR family transcriptional regulator, glycine cleavage system transcriptional activator
MAISPWSKEPLERVRGRSILRVNMESFSEGTTMAIPRRLLPSTSLLHAYEAVARTGSVSIAARELNLTQSAVSRQIKVLEEQIEVELFVRERQTLRLTLAGETYARDIRDALRRISIATLNIRANPLGGTLNLAVLPAFGARWLLKRLPQFVASCPDIVINFITRLNQFDFSSETLDAAIHFGHPQWPGAEYQLLSRETVTPVCSPALLKRQPLRAAVDVLKAPLLILMSRPDGWERWLIAHGAPPEGVHGMMFDQFELIIQAAIAGMGLGLLPRFLIEDELARGILVPAIDLPLESPEGYYLVWPLERSQYPPLIAFRQWLTRESAPHRGHSVFE